MASSPLQTTALDRATADLLRDVVAKLNQLGELTERNRKDIAGAAGEIARLSGRVTDLQATAQQRFMALTGQHQRGGSYRGSFASREEAAEVGHLAAAVIKRDSTTLAELRRAGITPGTGPEGGYLLKETLIEGILRDVEEAGVFERNCPAIPVGTLKGGGLKRTGGVTVYYPDYDVAATASTPALGRTAFSLKRYVAWTNIDNWMLASGLAAVLGDWIATEIAHSLALANDTNWFNGDGTSGYCGCTGLFKSTDLLSVTGDSGDDTFDEMIAKSTHYLALALGTLPQWAHAADPRWFMHLLTFFKYLGLRDTTGQPIANIITQQGPPALYLMGYPVVPVQIAPATTAASTVFALFGALRRTCRVYRHKSAVELKSTDQLKWLEAETSFAADVPQDMTIVNGSGTVQLKTAAS